MRVREILSCNRELEFVMTKQNIANSRYLFDTVFTEPVLTPHRPSSYPPRTRFPTAPGRSLEVIQTIELAGDRLRRVRTDSLLLRWNTETSNLNHIGGVFFPVRRVLRAMIPRTQRSKTARDPAITAQLEYLRRQMEQTQAEQQRLRNTLSGLARESDVSLSCVCSDCEEAYMLIKDGLMSCPSCSNQTSM